MEFDQTTLNWPIALADLAGEIRSTGLADGDEIIRFGSRLEELFSSVPGPLASTEFFGNRCLFALQKIYGKECADTEAVTEVVCQVLENINAVAEGDSDGMSLLSDAVDHLEELLAGNGAADDAAVSTQEETAPSVESSVPDRDAKPETVSGESSPVEEKIFNLHEIASMMVTVEADDLKALETIRQAMLHFEPDAPETVAQKVAEASVCFGKYIEGPQDESLLYTVSELIETSMTIMEDIENQGGVEPDSGTPAPDDDPQEIATETTSDMPAAISTDEIVSPEVLDAGADSEVDAGAEIPDLDTINISDDEISNLLDADEPATVDIAAEIPDATLSAEPEVSGDDTVDQDESIIPPDLDTDMAGEYITECREYLEDSEAALLDLEQDPKHSEAVNRVFRAFHTIKGTSGFLQLVAIASLAHKAETILSLVRDGALIFNSRCADLSLRSVDMLKVLLQVVQDSMSGGAGGKPKGYDTLLQALSDTDALERDTALVPVADEQDEPAPEKESQSKAATQSGAFETSVRVKTDRLDRLIDTVGELVIAQSMVAQDRLVAKGGDADLGRKVGHAGKIVRELQDLSMSMRMVPFKGTFQKMARLVRDLAQKNDKKVDFVREGEDTEIDRNMVDLIGDPLVHMIRNAVDHGIESPTDRTGAGKNPRGTVKLTAYHAGGNVIVQLSDDGKGLDPNVIFKKAVENGLVSADASLTDTEIFKLIFEAGFSTAEKVTDVSGRGVGMDVVRRNIESLNGRVSISSKLGQGTVFTIKLPLTMAITDGMLIRVGQQRFIIPTLNIEVSLRPEAEALATIAHKGEMLTLRGKQLPLYHLHDIFGVSDAICDATEGLVVVVDTGDQRYAVLVDELLGQLQVVVKSLSEDLGNLRGISGGAILGDGHVGLILDPSGLMQLAMTKGDRNDAASAVIG